MSMLKYFNTVWLSFVLVTVSVVWFYTDWLSRDSVASFLNSLGSLAFAGYIVVSLTRSLLLIPCTPFVLAGAISFPQWPLAVFFISVVGIVVGGLLVYSFPSFGGYNRLLEAKYPDKIAFFKKQLHGKYSFWIVGAWSFFPLVPTDAVCYAAGVVKMPLSKMLTALVLGELPIVSAYVFLGAEIGVWLRA